MVKHLTAVEQLWFQYSFAGREVDLASDELESTDTVQSVVAAYCETGQANNAIVSAYDDLDRRCARTLTTPEPVSYTHLYASCARRSPELGQ